MPVQLELVEWAQEVRTEGSHGVLRVGFAVFPAVNGIGYRYLAERAARQPYLKEIAVCYEQLTRVVPRNARPFAPSQGRKAFLHPQKAL